MRTFMMLYVSDKSLRAERRAFILLAGLCLLGMALHSGWLARIPNCSLGQKSAEEAD